MILFSHPTGNANVRAAALGLARAGLLGEFWTCVNYTPDRGLVRRLLPASLRAQFSRRAFPAGLQPFIRTQPWREIARLASHRLGLASLTRHEDGRFSVDAIYRALDRRVAARVATLEGVSAVYAYEDGAAHTFRAARKNGIPALYDLPIGYWRAARDLLTEEAELQPGWASTLIGNADSPAKTARKDEELALADVVYSASTYTLKTLAAAPGLRARVEVIPYGAPSLGTAVSPPPDARKRARNREDSASAPLRVLFVGSLGQRKGLSYLFAACRSLGASVALTVIGTRPLAPCAVLDAELARVRWIPSCPHAQVLAEMSAHDVFVFPSLFEGFGLVLLEAMACGLPVISTPHTAAPDLITDGSEGFVVPIRDAPAIAGKLDLLRRDRDRLRAMSAAAAARAACFTWESYGARLAASAAVHCARPAIK
ncbi:glycosyltransferase family 4 protein [Termitidicoccus mucosus]|uniref:glycosyltransferase family 4 protein n=1 Tax=Termitidicoccus mucosus TaxID=1184151 RepID=UPI0031843B8C